MLHNDVVKIENHISYAMLAEAVENPNVRQALKEISLVLITNVLKPLHEELRKVKQFSELPPSVQELLENLTAEHSAERRQYGAIVPEVESSKEIISSIENIQRFLQKQEEVLLNIDKAKTVDDIAIVLKTIVELGYTHYEAPQTWHRANFDKIKSTIAPTTEETDIRLFRTEMGETPKLALTRGIGTSEKDLGFKNLGKGNVAGKAVFGLVSMRARLELLCDEYDQTQLQKYADKMAYYKIPLNKNEREPIEVYAKKWETFFEKLIKNPFTHTSPPLIASVSRATARLLVALEDLAAFDKSDHTFDFEKAQIVANCIMGFIVHGAHHSIVEVAEVYNRLLDYVAIEHLEKEGVPIVKVEGNERAEEKMPYYRVGDYHSFFHRSYANKVASTSELQLDSQTLRV